MNDPRTRLVGYAFALPRLLARAAGRRVRRAELSRWEAYGTGLLVFGIACVFVARWLLPVVRPLPLQLLVALLLPFALWIAFLLVYFVNWLLAGFLRRLGLYSAATNNPFQHYAIISLTSLLALLLAQDENDWLKSLGIFWLGLVGLNLLSLLVLKLWHES